MPGFLNKAMDYLGLSDNDGYADYDSYEDAPAPPPRRAASAGSFSAQEQTSSVRVTGMPASDSGVSGVTGVQVQPRSTGSGSVRPLPPTPSSGKVHVVTPTSFSDAQEIGERFRSAQPVIITLTGADRDLKRRLVDFASGLAFGLNGHMEKVSDSVFMLTPSNVQVSADEKRRLQERGLLGSQ